MARSALASRGGRATRPSMRPTPRSASSRSGCSRPARGAPRRRSNETGEPGIVLVGRPYNIYDRSVNCDIPRKLRQHYGVNVIPLDFLVTGPRGRRRPPRQHVLDLGPADPRGGAPGRPATEPAHHLHHQLQVRARLVHQVLHPPGGRRAVADAAVRRPRQRRRLYDALRGVPRQQGNPAMLLGDEPQATGRRSRPPTDRQDGLHPADGVRQRAARSPPAFARSGSMPNSRRHPTHRTRELGARYTSRRRVPPGQGHGRRLHAGARTARMSTRRARCSSCRPPTAPAGSGSMPPTSGRCSTQRPLGDVEVLSPTSRNAYGGLGDAWPARSCGRPGGCWSPRDLAAEVLLQHRPYERRPGAADAALRGVPRRGRATPWSTARRHLGAAGASPRRRWCVVASGSPAST